MAKRGWLIAALALLIGLTFWLRRPASGPEGTTPPGVPPSGTPTAPSTLPGKTPDPSTPGVQTPPPTPSPAPAMKSGKLRVSIESAEGSFSGVLALLAPDGKKLGQQNAAGENAGSFEFDQLPPGPCRAVFVPTKGGGPASADATIPDQGEASASLRLAASKRLRGKVLDALQRPLVGVTLNVALPGSFGALKASEPRSLLFGTWSQTLSAPGVSGITRAGGYALSPDGTLRLSATSAQDGSFSIAGLPASAVQVEVVYQKLRFTQNCVPDVEASILVPVVPVESAPDPARVEFKRAADVLFKQMIDHPEAGDAYWDQLKTLLRDWMKRPGTSPADQKAVEDAILETDRQRAAAPK